MTLTLYPFAQNTIPIMRKIIFLKEMFNYEQQ